MVDGAIEWCLSWRVMLSILFVVIFLFGIMLAVALKRGLEMRELAERGVSGKGIVLKKFKTRGQKGGISSNWIKYQYQSSRGQTFQNKVSVLSEFFENHSEGDEVDLVYLNNKPKISALKYMVDLSKAALDKTKTKSPR
ncbi:MAG: hypothetical protein KDD42_01395 [Bdellovibrionales bacterium]|nr:hypothetical protein [Bdellovibrionales bacterium]